MLISLLEIICFQHSSKTIKHDYQLTTKISEDRKNNATPAELSSPQQQLDRNHTKAGRESPEVGPKWK